MEAKAGALTSVVRASIGATEVYLRQLAAALPVTFREHTALLVVIVAYWACGLVVGGLAGWSPTTAITMYLPTFQSVIPLTIVALLLGRALVIVALERPARPLTQFAAELRTTFASPQRIAHALPAVLGLQVFGGTFTILKISIPSLVPFSWDTPLEQFDRWLHGGIVPWQLLQPIFGVPIVTHALNWAYNSWFLVLGFILVWQTFSRQDAQLRLQFFFSFVLGSMLLGSVGAALFSSAGPCFFGRVTGLPDPFALQIDYLRAVDHSYPVWALRLQDMLWQVHVGRGVSIGAGISAMPSIHVAVATLFALVCWRAKRWLGIVMSIYALIILVGSVHLAWHYAVDGYFGAIGMIVIWWVVGRALSRQDRVRGRDPVTGTGMP
ncbi:MAG TPA: phosphatase PAP2 family protein [Dongiaceae bacterium]|jgi:hypothetical protein|nr:phosphatase PAP2 family protein [Dongiaceae bacterium]